MATSKSGELTVRHCCAGLSLSYNTGGPEWLVAVAALFWLSAVLWLSHLPTLYMPTKFKMPGAPFSTSLAILANLHLICGFAAATLMRCTSVQGSHSNAVK